MRQRVERRIKDCKTDRDGEQDEEQEEEHVRLCFLLMWKDIWYYMSGHSKDTYTVHLCI